MVGGGFFGGWFENNKRMLVPAGALSAAFTAWLTWYRGMSTSPAATVPFFAVCFALAVYGLKKASRRCNIMCAFFALVVAFFQLAGHIVRTDSGVPNDWTLSSLPPLIFMSAVFFILARGLVSVCELAGERRVASSPTRGKKLWLAFFCVILALWLPALLVLGPRISPDSTGVMAQALGGSLNDSHPVVYTLLFRLVVKPFFLAGNITFGVYLFCFLQMAFVAGALSASLYWLYRRGFPLWGCWLGAAYFTLTTVFAVNSITIWKDIPFNACLLLLAMLVYDNYRTGGELFTTRRGIARFCAVALAVCFLRGTGWALTLVVTLALAIAYRKRARGLLLAAVPLLVAVKLVTGPLYTALGIQDPLGAVQSLSVPLQQVSRVVAVGGDISEEELEFVDSFMYHELVAINYVALSPDYIKGAEGFNRAFFNSHVGEFMKVWFSVGLKNPIEYLNAWLLDTLGYWHVGFKGTPGVYYNDYSGAMGINQTDLISPLVGVDLNAYYNGNYQFISLGFLALLSLFSACLAIIRKDGKRLCALCVFLTVWLAMLLGAPTYYDFRYMLVFAYGLPALIFFTLHKERAIRRGGL